MHFDSRVMLVAMFGLGWPLQLCSQIGLAPGVVIDGKVVVRVYVTLHDERTSYFPVGGVELRFLRSGTDSVIAKTDDAGTVTTLLRPGDYRLTSRRDGLWTGYQYSWSLMIRVMPGMPVIDLTEKFGLAPNAPRAVAPEAPRVTPSPRPVAPRDGGASAPRLVPGALPNSRKNPNTATLISLLLAGGGHLYVGDFVAGVSLLSINALGWGIYIAAVERSRCIDVEHCRDATAQELAGLGVVAGSWLFSLFDSGAAARRYNDKLAVTVASARVTPMVLPGEGGGMRVGFAVR